MDEDLVASGRYARLEIPTGGANADDSAAETAGPTHPTTAVTVGFVELPDGTILVAATAPDARWARLLSAAARARFVVGRRSFDVTASELPPSDPRRGAAIRDLILRYGTPSESLGRGAVFCLERIADR